MPDPAIEPPFNSAPRYPERHGCPPPKGFDAVTTGTSGLWELRRDGETIGSIFIPPDLLALSSMYVARMVAALNGEAAVEGWPAAERLLDIRPPVCDPAEDD